MGNAARRVGVPCPAKRTLVLGHEPVVLGVPSRLVSAIKVERQGSTMVSEWLKFLPGFRGVGGQKAVVLYNDRCRPEVGLRVRRGPQLVEDQSAVVTNDVHVSKVIGSAQWHV